MPSKIPAHLPYPHHFVPALACPWGQWLALTRLPWGLTGTCLHLPHLPGLPPASPPTQISHSVFSQGLEDCAVGTVVPSRAQSSHYPPPGPPLGNSREPGRKHALADGTPGLSLKDRGTGSLLCLTGSSAGQHPPQPGTQGPRQGKATAGPGPALGCQASHIKTGWPPTISGVSVPVTGSFFSLWGLWSPSPSPIFLEAF